MSEKDWRPYTAELDQLVHQLWISPDMPRGPLLRRLSAIYDGYRRDAHPSLTRSDLPLLSFLEYLFFMAGGPYSAGFDQYAAIITRVLSLSSRIRAMLDQSAPHAIANMVLFRRGQLKMEIADPYELAALLRYWEGFGLQRVEPGDVCAAVLEKPSVARKIREGNPHILARLQEVFPGFTDRINGDIFLPAGQGPAHAGPSPDATRRYEQLLDRYRETGVDLPELIRIQERKTVRSGRVRNGFLSYLLRKKHGFSCQLCPVCGPGPDPGDVDVHHIIPVSEGGPDTEENMLVTCRYHHRLIHEGRITVRRGEEGEIEWEEGSKG